MARHVMNRRLTFSRPTITNTALGTSTTWAPVATVWGSRQDVSDAERATAGMEEATVRSRFVVRHSPSLAGLAPQDRLEEGGLSFAITGIKELASRAGYLEITADATLGAIS